ncbi:MAG: MIP family channel protein [Gemmatimonadetes bacterium]|nr:MIP family channel protein [Gemmatimonadota bacterium]
MGGRRSEGLLLLRRAAAEAVGTFFLVLVGTGTIMADRISGGGLGPVGIALAFGLVIAAMIYAVGHLSGAHINPAVTIGFWSIGRFPLTDVLVYTIAQSAGAVAASATLRLAIGDVARLGATVPSVPVPAAFMIEALLAFALMFVIAAVATDERVVGGFAGLAVGLTVASDALFGGLLTGASMNPARSLGPALVAGAWHSHWLYWVAPVLGMVAAAWTYEVLRPAAAPAVVRRLEPPASASPPDSNAEGA